MILETQKIFLSYFLILGTKLTACLKNYRTKRPKTQTALLAGLERRRPKDSAEDLQRI